MKKKKKKKKKKSLAWLSAVLFALRSLSLDYCVCVCVCSIHALSSGGWLCSPSTLMVDGWVLFNARYIHTYALSTYMPLPYFIPANRLYHSATRPALIRVELIE